MSVAPRSGSYLDIFRLIPMKMSGNRSTTGSRGWDPFKTYDATPDQMKAVQERAQMRAALKKEWQMKVSNPYRGPTGYIVSDLHTSLFTIEYCTNGNTTVV